MKVTIFVLVITFLSGCSIFTPPREQPLLVKNFGANPKQASNFAMAATDANRRLAILDVVNGQICVEPPPEAANTISEALTALLEADVQSKGQLGASLSQTISQNISQLYRRTQTVQLYRDAVFALCQSAINGTIIIDDATKASAPPDVREAIAFQISSLENSDFYDAEISEIKTKGLYSLKTLDALSIKANKLQEAKKPQEAEKLTDLTIALTNDLKRAEFRRRLADGLNEAFDVLKTELPMFYETEKLRFIVELGKPVQVCSSETIIEEIENAPPKKTIKDTCEAQMPSGIEKVIEEYTKALTAK